MTIINRCLFFTAILSTSVYFLGCKNEISHKISQAEALIYQSPDSALEILGNIEPDLSTKSEKARYSLIKIMASDAKHATNFSINELHPAIDYYITDGKGNPLNRKRSYYYQGRIYLDHNEINMALNSLTIASDIEEKCTDLYLAGKIKISIGQIYGDFLDFGHKTSEYLEASKIFKRLGEKSMEFDCLLNAFNGSILNKDKLKADSIRIALSKFHGLDTYQFNTLQNQLLLYAVEFGSIPDINAAILMSLKYELHNNDDLLNLALAYDKIGDTDKSSQLINFIEENTEPFDTLKFLAVSVGNYAKSGDYKSALDNYVTFTSKIDSINANKFSHHIRALEEKYQLEIEVQTKDNEKAKLIQWCLFVGLFFIFGIIILLLRNRNNKILKDLAIEKEKAAELENIKLNSAREKLLLENRTLMLEKENRILEAENLEQKIQNLNDECCHLKEIIGSQNNVPVEVQTAIKTRIEILNKLLAAHITDKSLAEINYPQWVKEYTANITTFMDSNRLAFKASHPRFILYLEDHGLTSSEINYVCLYAIGLRGKEVGNYIKKRSHVNISSAIRKKLGIDKHDTNLGIYVRRLLQEL